MSGSNNDFETLPFITAPTLCCLTALRPTMLAYERVPSGVESAGQEAGRDGWHLASPRSIAVPSS
jgi:hypothetical protein